jgi:diguanylate cyclase (GGDEF)-like protein/PAS domain S-box-containing protein
VPKPGQGERRGPQPWRRSDAPSRSWLPRPGGPTFLVLLGLVLFLLAAPAVQLNLLADGRVSAWWPAAGVGLLGYLAVPRGRRAAVPVVVLIATFAANALVGRPVAPSLGYATSNALEVVVVGWWLLRGRSRATLETIDDVVRLLVGVGLGVLALGLGIGATAVLTGYGTFVPSAAGAMTSHAAAMLIVVPLGLAARNHGSRRPRGEAALQSAGLALVALLVFGLHVTAPVGFILVPLVVWGALRLSPRFVAGQILVLAVAITSLTASGSGPIAGAQLDRSVTALLVQGYLLSLAVVALPLVVAATTRRHVLEGLVASERLFRQGFSESLVGMMLLRVCRGDDGTSAHTVGGLDVVELNPVAARLLEQREESVLGSCWTSTLDERDRLLLTEVVEAMVRGRVPGWRGEVELLTHHGPRFLELAVSPLPATVGDGMFVAQLLDVTARREAEERLTAQALRDALTGMANRTLLRDRLELALSLLPAAEPGPDGTVPDDGAPSVGLLFCDLDDFKHVNDSAGHTVGDLVLVEVAHRLQSLLAPGDLAARLGGDEFVLLRPRVGPGEAEALAAEVIDLVCRPVDVDGQSYSVGMSIGVVHSRPGETAEELLRDADAAMYAAKAEGKRRAVVYSDVHRERALRLVRLEAELHRALAEGELRVHLQPVVDLRTGVTTAAEALVRWEHPERGLLPPGEWLDVAERGGLMPQLGAWVLQEACAQALTWPAPALDAAGARPVCVHVNISARQLEQECFLATVRGALERTGLPPERLVLEFTETHLDEVTDALLEDLVGLREMGIGLAADDYGTGYSPLTRIIELPLSMIKIDRRFVGDMLEDVRSRAVVTTLLRLGQSLGLEVVAEGVETPAAAAALAELGCLTGQGYLWSRPLPAEEFGRTLLLRDAVLPR